MKLKNITGRTTLFSLGMHAYTLANNGTAEIDDASPAAVADAMTFVRAGQLEVVTGNLLNAPDQPLLRDGLLVDLGVAANFITGEGENLEPDGDDDRLLTLGSLVLQFNATGEGTGSNVGVVAETTPADNLAALVAALDTADSVAALAAAGLVRVAASAGGDTNYWVLFRRTSAFADITAPGFTLSSVASTTIATALVSLQTQTAIPLETVTVTVPVTGNLLGLTLPVEINCLNRVVALRTVQHVAGNGTITAVTSGTVSGKFVVLPVHGGGNVPRTDGSVVVVADVY